RATTRCFRRRGTGELLGADAPSGRLRPGRGADGGRLLPGLAAGRAAFRGGGRHRGARADALHPRGDEVDERDQDGRGGSRASESYLRIPSLIAAATTTGCEAVHPGWGFLAENPAFVEACADNDLVFVGPSAETMARMGDKVQAKAEMRAADVPVVPGTEGATTLDEARTAAEEGGYPVLLKATAGGGGKGMRLVTGPEELEPAFTTASLEAEAAF